ncbi:MAG: tyrosine--tRNA ligase [Planctomycetota bacterium]
MTTAPTLNLYDTLEQRGLVAQTTDTPDVLRARLSQPEPVTAYCGFDPTADSLHVGSLVPIMALAHLQRAGHRPIVVVGGATALVGDPSGKTEARQMLSREQIDTNAGCIGDQIGRIVNFTDTPGSDTPAAVLVNNADWLADLSWIDLLREAGPHFSVNRMLTMDSVRSRMDAAGSGISFLEFNYMVMQAYDFLHLHRSHGCTLQLGGQDQWGNIVMGIELGRRLADASLAGLTLPLVTKSDGSKFGKSESGNIWLDANRTPPYDFFQFWRNTADADVGKFLGYFTFLPIEEVQSLAVAEGPALNESKAVLAYEVTKLVHGEAEAAKARDAAAKAFGAGDVTADGVPNQPLPKPRLADGVTVTELIRDAGFASSNGEARRLVQGGGVRLHDTKVADPFHAVTADDAPDGYVLLRVGKKKLCRFDLVD